MASFNPHLVARRIEDHYTMEEIKQASIWKAGYMIDSNMFIVTIHHQVGKAEVYMSDKQAAHIGHDHDANGLPFKVLYYSYQDLWAIDDFVEKGQQQSILNVHFHPASQLKLSSGQIPTQTPFPGSKGYVDLAINWLYSWLPSGQSDKTVRFNEQHWLGDTIIIGDIHDKIKRK